MPKGRDPLWDNEEALAGTVNLIAVLGDNKYYLGRAVSEWAVGAPTLESAVACAAIAQEELGHARGLYPLLDELPFEGGPEPLEREADRARRYCVSYVDRSLETWPELVAALALIDPATFTLIEALQDCTYEPLARRVRRMPDEERFHMEFAEGRVRDLADVPDGLPEFQAEVERLLPEVLCWFGPAGERGVEVMKEEGLLRWDNQEMRQAYLGRVAPLLLEVGVRVPVQWDLARKRWDYMEELPWDRWNRLQRRLTVTAGTPRRAPGAAPTAPSGSGSSGRS